MRRNNLPVRCLAVVAAVLLVGAGCAKGAEKKETKTGAAGGVEKSVKKNTVKLTALYYTEDSAGEPSGGSSEVTVNVEPTGEKKLKVGFLEDEVGGSGGMWRASGWEASAVAILLTGIDPSKKEITFEVGGRTDGPSAGCLMTVGVLAALRGDKVKKDVTMTGTINPDGTVGPVGGINYKLQGAKKAHKKLMLIPSGQMQVEDAQGNLVDVGDLADKENVKVKEVKDVYEAYKAFTGRPLPRLSALEGDVELERKVVKRLQALVTKWLGTYQEAKGQLATLTPAVQEAMADMVKGADDSAAAAQKFVEQSLPAGAYSQAQLAAIQASSAYQAGRMIELYYTQGVDAVKGQLESNQAASTKVDALIEKLKQTDAKTLSDMSALIDAYGVAIDSVSAISFAKATLDKQVANEQEAIVAVSLATVFYTMAELGTQAAEDSLDLLDGLDGPKPAKNIDLTVIADFFRKAAEANLGLFESVIVERQAQQAGVSTDIFKEYLANADIDYGLAVASQGVQQTLKEYFGKGEPLDFATLGGSVNLFSRSSALLAKYYALKAEFDDNYNIVSLGRPKALLTMLDFADDQVKSAIGVLQERKVNASLPAFYYQTAQIDREGNLDDKLNALGELWLGFVQARVLSFLGQFSGAGLG